MGGNKMLNYKPFESLINQRRNEIISEALFLLKWGICQREQGIIPQRGRFTRPFFKKKKSGV
jgi:hypothetical protein